eukprot:6099934-Pyramimonas_sp.AAC.1
MPQWNTGLLPASGLKDDEGGASSPSFSYAGGASGFASDTAALSPEAFVRGAGGRWGSCGVKRCHPAAERCAARLAARVRLGAPPGLGPPRATVSRGIAAPSTSSGA